MTVLDVLIAHESPELSLAIAGVLGEVGLTLAEVRSGEEALTRLLRDAPRVLVVDVAIPGRASFELCDAIQEAGLPTRVVLVASVYDRTRYKRRPASLYGADDYVEQHHIPDLLPGKVAALLGRERPEAGAAATALLEPAAVEGLRQAANAPLTITYATPEEGQARARRLAELLLHDMLLYNGDVLPGLGPGAELPPRLAADLAEAQRIYDERVPVEVRAGLPDLATVLRGLLQRRRASRADLQAIP